MGIAEKLLKSSISLYLQLMNSLKRFSYTFSNLVSFIDTLKIVHLVAQNTNVRIWKKFKVPEVCEVTRHFLWARSGRRVCGIWA